MPRKTRRLWLEILFKVPAGISRELAKQTLIQTVRSGAPYHLPDNWYAVIKWRNKENVPMKTGEWTSVLIDSAKSSKGFDAAVIAYLERH